MALQALQSHSKNKFYIPDNPKRLRIVIGFESFFVYYRATFSVVRIPRAFATRQSAFYSPRNLILYFFKGFTDFGLNLIAQFDIVSEQLFHGLTSLSKFLVTIAEP